MLRYFNYTFIYIYFLFFSKNREIADYQLKQHMARNLAIQEQKKKDIDFEKRFIDQLKEE